MPGEPSYNDLVSKIQIGEGTAFTHALRASAIPYGQVDSTSTATAFTATVPGINTLKDGVCVLLKNGVVTSASGFTINVNGLGAKPSYTNLAAATRDTTIFNVGYTMLFIYDEDRVSGGCWICYRGYDANTNTIGYQLRTNSSTLPAADKGYKYRLWFTSADGAKWVPANTSTSTDATTSRNPNTTPINPFGPIVYNSTNGTVNANASLPAATLWQQYAVTIGYSFNEPNGAMTFPAPVYLKCTPQTNGSAVMVGLVQALPSTNDGYIYILLGRAYSATSMELITEHPVFYHDGTAIRLWTGAEGLAPLIGSTANTTPTQVLAALQAGKNVYITHTDATFGNISFTSFAYSASLNTVQAQAVVRVYVLTAVTLSGDVSTDTWTLGSDALEHDPIVQYIHVNGGEALPNINNGVDITIPTKTSDLTNDSGFITSAPVTSVNGQTGAVTTAEKFVITATAISGTDYYNLDKTYADIASAISYNEYVTIEDVDMTYPYTTITTHGIVFGATLIATGEGNQLMAVTDGILVVPPESGTNAMGIAVHSTNVLPTMSDIPSASNTTPLMDGTADVGIQTYIYARADHVHPTDTSRQATLVSGTNIKTINNESILGSGNISISAGSGDTLIATVTFTGTQYTESYSCDTTYDSLYSALSSGRDVILRYKDTSSDNNLYNFFLSEGFNTIHSGDTLYFSRVTDNGEIHRFSVTNTDYWAYSSYKIASTKVDALDSTSKLYLVGAKNQQSSVTSYSNSNVYATNGVLNATSFSINESANIVYNSSSKSIDFTFV